jgi:hypothetical protein
VVSLEPSDSEDIKPDCWCVWYDLDCYQIVLEMHTAQKRDLSAPDMTMEILNYSTSNKVAWSGIQM